MLNCALSEISGEFRCVIGARPGRARVIRDENGILKNGITQESAAAFADYAKERIPTGSNLRAGSEYRSHLVRVVTERNLMRLGGME